MKSKIIIKKLFLGLVVLFVFYGCQKEFSTLTEQQGSHLIKWITIEDLENQIGSSKAYLQMQEILSSQHRNIVNIELQTDEIVLIELNGQRHYTLKLINNDLTEESDIFYNLIFEEDVSTGEVLSNIYKYDPDPNWLDDTTQPFFGTVQILPNDYFVLSDINKSSGAGRCVTGAYVNWECSESNPHDPNDPMCTQGIWWQYWLNLTYGPCPDPTETEIDAGDSSTGGGNSNNGGGNTNGNSSNTVILVPCNVNGGFNDPNGGACIPVEDHFEPYLCSQNQLTQTQIDWIFANQSNTDNAEQILHYLENNPQNGCVEVDFENNLVFTTSFKQTKAYCVLQLLLDSNNNLFRNTVSQFTSNDSTIPLVFDHAPLNNSSTEASTHYDEVINIAVITLNSNNNSANDNSLIIAGSLLHETIHAELYGIINTENNLPNPLPYYQYQYILELLDYYSNNSSPAFTMSNAQHTFMVANHVEPIALAVRSLDDNRYPLENYLAFGWEGLYDLGVLANVITSQDVSNYINLSSIPLNDSYETSCD
jgi:hypothetical protein